MIPHPSGGAVVTDERLANILESYERMSPGDNHRLELVAIFKELQSRRADPVREELEQAPPSAPHPSHTASNAWRLLPEGYRDLNQAPFDGSDVLLWIGWMDKPGFSVGRFVNPLGFEVMLAKNDRRFPKRVTHWQPMLASPEAESAATHEMGAERSGASPPSSHPRTGSPKEST